LLKVAALSGVMSASDGARFGLCVAVAAVNDRERAARADEAGRLFSAWAQARRASMLNVLRMAVYPSFGVN
jgi:hypothetical protein